MNEEIELPDFAKWFREDSTNLKRFGYKPLAEEDLIESERQVHQRIQQEKSLHQEKVME